MDQYPDDAYQNYPKRKNEERPRRPEKGSQRGIFSFWACAIIFVMIAVGLILGIGIAVITIPIISNLNGEQVDYAQLTAEALATENALLQQQEFANQQTQIALDMQGQLLDITATYSARSIVATQTASAARNNRQKTQIAINYQATQFALQQQATKVELDFQATRASNESDAENLSLESSIADVVALPTQEARSVILSDTFDGNINQSLWDFEISNWRNEEGIVKSATSNAKLLTRQGDLFDWIVEFDITAPPYPSDLFLILNYSADHPKSHAIRLVNDGELVNEIYLYEFDETAWSNDLLPIQMIELNSRSVAIPNEAIKIEVNSQDDQIAIAVNDIPVLSSPINIPAGRIGIQVPADTALNAFRVLQ